MSNSTSGRRAKDCVLTCEVTCNTADRGALQTTLGKRRCRYATDRKNDDERGKCFHLGQFIRSGINAGAP
jgi:hypothetical protein